jgi:hypothetical protein
MPLKEIRRGSPSPPFRGEREGPVAQRREGEVGGAANEFVCATGNMPDTIDRIHG